MMIGQALLNILWLYEMKNMCRESVKTIFRLDACMEYWSTKANEVTSEFQSGTYKQWLWIL